MIKKLFIILGFIAALTAVVFAVTPHYNLAIPPIIVAFISGLIILFLSKKDNKKTKTIQYIFLMVIIALALTIYKSVYVSPEAETTEQLEQSNQESSENPKETSEGTNTN